MRSFGPTRASSFTMAAVEADEAYTFLYQFRVFLAANWADIGLVFGQRRVAAYGAVDYHLLHQVLADRARKQWLRPHFPLRQTPSSTGFDLDRGYIWPE